MSFAVIDLQRLRNNFLTARQKAKGAKVFCVVKSDAYGCGLVKVAKVLQSEGADGFVVAKVEEGVLLRESKITLPIIVLNGFCKENATEITKYGLIPSVYNFETLFFAVDFCKKLKLQGAKKINICLKMNCGFNRLGFCKADLPKVMQILSLADGFLSVFGVFAHLRDGNAKEEYRVCRAKAQTRIFCDFAMELKKYPQTKYAQLSLLNSGGLVSGLPAFDIVRCGAILYGLGDCDETLPIMSFFASFLQINLIKKGESLGYDDSFVADRDTFVAVLDIGYADGLPRQAKNRGMEVFVNGKLYPFVGSVCMNHSFVALPDGEHFDATSHAELFGKHISPRSVAEKLDTIDYEIFCRFGKNANKVYI